MFNALSSQLDFVGLHLLGSMVFDGLVGGVLSACVGVLAEASSSSIFTPVGVCVRPAGSAGFATTSPAVDVVVLLLTELEVPGRSWVMVVLLWLDAGLEVGCGELSRLTLVGLELAVAVTALGDIMLL